MVSHLQSLKLSDIELVTKHGVYPSSSIDTIDTEIGHRALTHFTDGLSPSSRILPLWPFKKKYKHGQGSYILMYHLYNKRSISFAVANPGFIMMGSFYYTVNPNSWLDGQMLVVRS